MNILFLTLSDYRTTEEHGIYQDLMREFAQNGHSVFIVSPNEKRNRQKTSITEDEYSNLLRVKTGNIQKTNLIEKGISTLRLEGQFKRAIKKHFKGVKFDLILYSTPPISFEKVVRYVKKRDSAKTFLLLKDIFPQNAVDIGILKKSGLKGFIYRYFRKKEKRLYAVSDKIGCMSQANCDYVLKHNSEVPPEKVIISPNSIDPVDVSLNEAQVKAMRIKYGLPVDKKIFVYGGNLGKPQDIPFIIECLRSQKQNEGAYFLIVGSGTEYHLLEKFTTEEQPANVKLMKYLPKEDFDAMLAACDVGMIFLDHRFTIPNYPSRLLSYMQAGLPVLACTDPNTDVGSDIVRDGFGWWCSSSSVSDFGEAIAKAMTECKEKSKSVKSLLIKKYSVADCYKTIL